MKYITQSIGAQRKASNRFAQSVTVGDWRIQATVAENSFDQSLTARVVLRLFDVPREKDDTHADEDHYGQAPSKTRRIRQSADHGTSDEETNPHKPTDERDAGTCADSG